MIRWFLIGIVLLANIATVLFALTPILATFAEVVPDGISCGSCDSPEVMAALIRSAIAGRAQIIGVVSSNSWLFISIACFNVVAVIAALFMPTITQRSNGTIAIAPTIYSLRSPITPSHKTHMSEQYAPIAIVASEAPPRSKASSYPEPFASLMAGREKRPLGDLFGLTNFGVNLTRLAPNAVSTLRHTHTKQDEFIYILQGYPTLHTDDGRTQLSPGTCAGFKAGSGNGHHLINETSEEVIYLEVGDRSPGDEGSYPDDDLKALFVEGKWEFVHKDGTPYK